MTIKLHGLVFVLVMHLAASALPAQHPDGPPPGGGRFPGGGDRGPGPPPHNSRRPPPFSGENGPPDGKWWTNPIWVQRLALSNDQQRRIDEIFQQYRVKLIDLRAALEKQEALLEPMLDADHPQEARVLAQIDRIADARADLEKANARMLWGFRQILTVEQWRQLESAGSGRSPGRR